MTGMSSQFCLQTVVELKKKKNRDLKKDYVIIENNSDKKPEQLTLMDLFRIEIKEKTKAKRGIKNSS
jgi:flagellar biosynthesis chaperone FliJ